MLTTEETRQHHAELALQEAASRLVSREVHCCLSTLVATLARGYGNDVNPADHHDLGDLCAQAHDLAAPVEDYEEAATQDGWRLHKCDDGTFDAIEKGEDAPTLHNLSAETAWQDVCEHAGTDPYQREVFEHWAVSEWLADKLAAEGERIDPDFAGLIVWSRTTTGQAISMDHCIRSIARKMMEAT